MGELNRDQIDRLADMSIKWTCENCPYRAAGLCDAGPAELVNCNKLRKD